VGLDAHKGKTKILNLNAASVEPVKLEENEIQEVEAFTYLGSIIDKHGGTDEARREVHLCSPRTSGVPKCCHCTQRYPCLTPT